MPFNKILMHDLRCWMSFQVEIIAPASKDLVFALMSSNPILSDLDFYSQFRGLIWGSLDHLQWKEWYYRCPRPLGLFLNHSMALFSRSLAPESMKWEIQTGTVGTRVKPTAIGTVRDTASDMLVIFWVTGCNKARVQMTTRGTNILTNRLFSSLTFSSRHLTPFHICLEKNIGGVFYFLN